MPKKARNHNTQRLREPAMVPAAFSSRSGKAPVGLPAATAPPSRFMAAAVGVDTGVAEFRLRRFRQHQTFSRRSLSFSRKR